MNSRIYYKYLSSRIASKWTVLLIDLLIVLISMLLAFALQWRISSVTYDITLYRWMMVATVLCSAIFFQIFHTYIGIIRFSSFVDIYRVFISLTLSYGLLGLGNFCWSALGFGITLPGGILFIAYLFTLIFMICLRIAVKMIYETIAFDARHSVNVFIYGFYGTGVNVAKALRVSRNNHFRLRGFISDEPDMIGKHTMGCRVYANDEHLLEKMEKKDVQTIIVSPSKEMDLEKSGMMEVLQSRGIHVMTLPPLSDCMDDGLIKDIRIGDWLRREPIKVDIRRITSCIEGSRIMVTGAAGAVGREIVRQIAALNPYRLILVDQAESPLYDVQLELSDHWKNLDVRVLVADVANRTRMEAVFREVNPQLVFHAAAYKNEQLMDDFISEAIQANVEGTLNVAELSLKYNVDRCVVISTDRVVRYVSMVDGCKWLGEMVTLALARRVSEADTKKMMIVRFGEVYPYDSCSLMTMPEVCQLILEVCSVGENGAVYLLGDEPASYAEPTAHAKVMKCKVKAFNHEKVYADIIALARDSYTENQDILRNGINSFSETSQ